MHHVCYIKFPRGFTMLVGVVGSSEQSLTQLTAFVSGLEAQRLWSRRSQGIPDPQGWPGTVFSQQYNDLQA